jgi:iron(III) transport system ATP-binding protein
MLNLKNITVRYGKTPVLDDVSLEVSRAEVVCLLGASGAGKSTLLRIVAGIDRPTGGQVFIDGVEVSSQRAFVEPENRHVGMVFQDYALFPHLTVAANVAFGLRASGQRDGRDTVRNLLARLGLERLADSYPHMLSGGESQRVALARAMAPMPRILLMDEPFSSLDSRLRDDVRRHTFEFIRESGTTTVMVTHDPDEALRVGDRIALLDSGRLVQFGPPEELYAHPRTLAAARFFSDIAALPGICRNGRLETPLGAFAAPSLVEGAEATACIRPQHFRLAAWPTGISARVISSEFCGDSRYLLVKVDSLEAPVVLHEFVQGVNGHGAIQPGTIVHLEISVDDVPVVAVSQSIKESTNAEQSSTEWPLGSDVDRHRQLRAG